MSRDFAYASSPDVLAHLAFTATFTATSRPNATQVHHHLTDASNELDSALALVDYSVPVATGATIAAEMLRGWAALGAGVRTTAAMPQGTDSKHLLYLDTEWKAILKAIRDGQQVLPDAGKATGRSHARFPDDADTAFTADSPDDA